MLVDVGHAIAVLVLVGGVGDAVVVVVGVHRVRRPVAVGVLDLGFLRIRDPVPVVVVVLDVGNAVVVVVGVLGVDDAVVVAVHPVHHAAALAGTQDPLAVVVEVDVVEVVLLGPVLVLDGDLHVELVEVGVIGVEDQAPAVVLVHRERVAAVELHVVELVVAVLAVLVLGGHDDG